MRRRPSSTGPAGPLPSSIAPQSTATARTLTARARITEKTTARTIRSPNAISLPPPAAMTPPGLSSCPRAAPLQRGQEGLPARGAHAAQAGEEVRLHQAVPQGPQEGLRERRQQVSRPLVRALRARGVHLPPGGVLRRGPQEALLQGRQAGQEGEVRGVQGGIPRPCAGVLEPVVYLKNKVNYM